ncbi:DUF6458 family protein [Serinicoccus sediminis]|uniref:DUF6458 family protein n=1 Tax=Serinicoccus sediminis TaxID=2306021 RepID=UPI00101EA823|nr:DUF6458 family protein [Serinicoccus sediminis]
MGIGIGIFLLVVGAVLTFAIQTTVEGVNLDMVGYIFMAAGVLSLLLGLVMNTQRTNTTHREVVDRGAGADARRRDGY